MAGLWGADLESGPGRRAAGAAVPRPSRDKSRAHWPWRAHCHPAGGVSWANGPPLPGRQRPVASLFPVQLCLLRRRKDSADAARGSRTGPFIRVSPRATSTLGAGTRRRTWEGRAGADAPSVGEAAARIQGDANRQVPSGAIGPAVPSPQAAFGGPREAQRREPMWGESERGLEWQWWQVALTEDTFEGVK